MTNRLHLPIIDQDQILKLHDATLYLLATVGMRVQGKGLTRRLLDYGCRDLGERILFPAETLKMRYPLCPGKSLCITMMVSPWSARGVKGSSISVHMQTIWK